MQGELSGFQFNTIDSSLLFSRGDREDPRLGDLTKALPSSQSLKDYQNSLQTFLKAQPNERTIAIAGYPDDEGIRLNGGRLGASQAPSEVRRYLYKMTPALKTERSQKIIDIGDLATAGKEIELRHEIASRASLEALNAGAVWIGIGGGHDYGYPDASAFCQWIKKTKNGMRPLVINFDAHLDVRPPNRGLSSGTPFYRMLENYPEVDFAEIGIQAQCNSRSHLEWVRSKGARVLTQEELESSGLSLTEGLTDLLKDWLFPTRPVFISVDIDGFSSAVAPGCSQSWATGFMPDQFFPCLNFLAQTLDIKMLGVYEVSPPLDQDMRTAKLAAQIIHRVIYV